MNYLTVVILFFSVLGAVDKILGNKFVIGKELEKAFMLLGTMALSMISMIVLSRSFHFMYILSKILSKLIEAVSKKMRINEQAVLGLISCLASNVTSFGMMDKMDKKGVVLNSAFAVSGAFVLGGHLAFTIAFDETYVVPVILGKIISGVLAIIVANLIFRKTQKQL